MARITLRQLLDHAAEHGYGVPAFNINNMEQGLAIMEAADAVDAPVIIQARRGARSYANDIMLKHMMDAVTEIYPHIPVCVHLDHGNNARDLHDRDPGRLHLGDDGRFAEGGRQDPGRLGLQRRRHPARSSRWRISAASRSRASSACWVRSRPAWARRRTATAPRASSATTSSSPIPDEAVKFVAETKVDALAIAMGTSHGAYKFTRKPDGAILAMNVIEEIHRRLPNMHLVMHGSSSVPQDLQDIINQYGGKMPQTWGVPVEEIQRGIKHGVRKINIDTDNRMAMTGQIRKILAENPGEFDPRKYLKPAMEAMTKLCKQRLQEFNTAGQAVEDQARPDLGRNGQALRRGRAGPEIRHGAAGGRVSRLFATIS